MHEIISWLPAELASLPRYVVALAIGLLMGLERERNPAAKAGLRTFALTALLGVLAAHLGTALDAVWLIPVGLLLVGAMMIAAYLRDPVEDGDPGTTTVAALMLCYGLGVLVWHDEIQLAVMLGIAATMLLYFTPAGSPSRARRSCWDRRRSPGASARSPRGITTGWSGWTRSE